MGLATLEETENLVSAIAQLVVGYEPATHAQILQRINELLAKEKLLTVSENAIALRSEIVEAADNLLTAIDALKEHT